MTLSEKLPYAFRHIDSIMRHDEEPLEVRERAAARLIEYIQTELVTARVRQTPEWAEQRKEMATHGDH